MPKKTDPVFILGAGAWGLSTALHLNDQGYADITVFDRADEIPSRYSAAYDLNKIVRAEYEDAFYTELALVSPDPATLPPDANEREHLVQILQSE
jgi:sarcosine oxidase / L-pipecolate oxidase